MFLYLMDLPLCTLRSWRRGFYACHLKCAREQRACADTSSTAVADTHHTTRQHRPKKRFVRVDLTREFTDQPTHFEVRVWFWPLGRTRPRMSSRPCQWRLDFFSAHSLPVTRRLIGRITNRLTQLSSDSTSPQSQVVSKSCSSPSTHSSAHGGTNVAAPTG